jgi:hypothetical protein
VSRAALLTKVSAARVKVRGVPVPKVGHMGSARVAIGVVLTVLCGLAVAPAIAAEHVVTIRVIQTRISQRAVDLGARGRSLGDVVVATHELRRAAPNADVPIDGRIGTSSTATTALGRSSWNVVSTAAFSGGTITFGGVTRRTVGTLAVLGGTGAHASARGTANVKG